MNDANMRPQTSYANLFSFRTKLINFPTHTGTTIIMLKFLISNTYTYCKHVWPKTSIYSCSGEYVN